MKFTFFWNEHKQADEVEITSHPLNEKQLMAMTTMESPSITVTDPKNDRVRKLAVDEVESISALGHVSKVLTIKGETFFLQKRMKELTDLEQENLFRINNSMILNLNQVSSFSVGSYARLEVFTKVGHTYTVSRHYAKYIKERLL